MCVLSCWRAPYSLGCRSRPNAQHGKNANGEEGCPMINILHEISVGIGIVGVAVIIWGVVLTLVRVIILEASRIRKKSIYYERESLRHQLGSYLLLGIEFLIAADIIGTVTHPTLEDMAVLASIVVIRTLISFFLDREIVMFKSGDRQSRSDPD